MKITAWHFPKGHRKAELNLDETVDGAFPLKVSELQGSQEYQDY
jgi:hypothetical protein